MERLKTSLPVMFVALSALVAVGVIALGPYAHADDAYIVARYAEHLVEHRELTWNLGEAPVEGFTGYTLLAMMTLATWLHLPPVGTAAVLGILAWFAGARILYACHVPLGASRLAGAVATSLFLCAAEQSTHAMSGLETEWFVLTTLACVFVAARRAHEKPGAGALWPLPIWVTLCAWTRPEGVVVGGAMLLGVVIRERAAWRAWFGVTLGGFVVPWGALQLFRWWYFGSFFPNTYYAKLAKVGESSVFVGSFWTHAQKYLVPTFVAFLAMFVVRRVSGAQRESASNSTQAARRIVLLGAVASYAVIGSSYARSDLVMNYSERFAYHFFGLSAVLVLLAVSEVHQDFRAFRASRRIRSTLFVLLAVCVYLPFVRALEQWPRERMYRYNYTLGKQTHYEPIVHWLGEHMPRNATLAVYPDAGLVPYSTGLKTLDFGKLNDVYLARHARHASDVVDYFFRQDPDALMIFLARGLEGTYDEAGDRLLADPRFAKYQLVQLSLDQGRGTALFVKR